MIKSLNETREIIRTDGKKYSVRFNRNRVFLPSEWAIFYNCLKDSQKFTFNLLVQTGARINEARHIKVNVINFIKKVIILSCIKQKTHYSSGRIRIIPISDKLIREIKEHIKFNSLNQEDYLGVLSTPAANIAMKKALIKAGIHDWKMFSVHNIRKTLETWLMATHLEEIKILVHFGHDKSTAIKHYLQTDTFSQKEKNKIREIIGNLYYSNGEITKLNNKIFLLEKQFNELKEQWNKK